MKKIIVASVTRSSTTHPDDSPGASLARFAQRLAICSTIILTTWLAPVVAHAQYAAPNLMSVHYTGSPFARHTSPLLVGQCTWYVYGRIQEVGVISPATLTSKGILLGNATTWATSAANAGYATGSTPRAGAIAVWTSGIGHVAFVESVLGGVPQFTECNTTPTTTTPNTVVVCRDDTDTGAWKVRLRSSASTTASTLGYLPKFNVFTVVGGPTSANGYSWYHLQGGGYDGWAALLGIDSGNAATPDFSWSFTRIKLTASSPSFASGNPSTYIYLSSPPPAPTITSVSPNPVTGSNSRQTVTIYGNNFVNKPTLTLTWTGQAGYTVPDPQVTYVSANQIQMSITTTTSPDNWTVKVTNLDGQSSSAAPFTVVSIPPPPAPTITSVSPNPVTGSNSRQSITINGNNFVNKPTLTLTWTGQSGYAVPDAQVTYLSANQIQMSITTTTSPDNWTVKVTNPDGQSSGVAPFSVGAPPPPPAISSVSPNPVTGSNARKTITIYGNNFVSKPTLTLTWTGQSGYAVPDAQVTYLSASQIQMSITTTTSPDNWTVKVTNPDGQFSSTTPFTVVEPPPAPSITSITPNPVTGSNTRQTITISGNNFVNKPALTLTWTGQAGYIVPDAQVTYLSANQIQMSITTTTSPDNWTVKVTNPDGQSSGVAPFTVVPPPPQSPSITSISPNPVTGSNTRQTITIYGNNFISKPTLTLTWTGQVGYPVPAAQVIFISANQIQMSITTTTSPDNWTVKVTNPDGQFSSTTPFTVVEPPTVSGEPQSLGVTWTPSQNFDNRPANHVIDAIVFHTTEGNYASALSRLTDTSVPIEQRVSADYIIKSTGEIVQLVDLSKRAWHATYYNDRSIGIEMVGIAGQASTWNAQNLGALENLVAYLVTKYNIPLRHPAGDASTYPNCLFTENGLVSHSQVQPGCNNAYAAKSDPGPYFPWASFVSNVQAKLRPRITGTGGGGFQRPRNGLVELEVSAPAQTQITVQVSDDLTNWTDLATVMVVNGKVSFSDSDAGLHARRFYRVIF